MPTFAMTSRADVVPKQKIKGPSQRTIMQEQHASTLRDALDAGQALVIGLERDDKVLTVKNRINCAIKALGREDLTVRQRGNRVVVYAAASEA
jgi:hypothetical protein